MNFDQRFEHLKEVAKNVPKDKKQQLSFIKSQKKDFNGKYSFISSNFNDGVEIKGSVNFIPLKVRVMSSNGNLNLYLVCDVIFENIKFSDKQSQTIFDGLVSDDNNNSTYERISNLFSNVPIEEFEKLVRLIGMGDFKLQVNNIVVK